MKKLLLLISFLIPIVAMSQQKTIFSPAFTENKTLPDTIIKIHDDDLDSIELATQYRLKREYVPYRNAHDSLITLHPIKSSQLISDTTYNTTGTEVIGSRFWDSENNTTSLVLPNGVVLQDGEELFFDVINQTGGDLVNGKVASYAGAIGASGKIKAKYGIADYTIEEPNHIMGIVTEPIANGGFGKITYFGKVRGIQTNGANYSETWVDGDILYVSTSSYGGLTNVMPEAPSPAIPIAIVVKAHATMGTIMVRPTFPVRLQDLADVNGTSLTTDGQFPSWHNTEKYFDFDKNINNYKLKSDSISLSGYFTNYKALLKEDKANKENITVDNNITKFPTVNLLKTYADTKDPSSTNELNSSLTFNTSTNDLTVADAGGNKTANISVNADLLINGYSGTISATANPISFNWPVAYSDTNYYLDIFAHYTETIDGKSVLIRNAVYDFVKTTTGFYLKLDTLAGVVEYRASRTINSETPANVLLQSDLTTTVGSPGLDTKIPTEKAVRTALSGVVVTETDPVYSASSWFGTTNNSTNWNTAYTDRLKWDGGSTGLTAATGRTSLGGTTIGQAMFTSTNPSAVTFGRANADNTFSWLNATDFKTAIGGGTTINSQTIKFDTGTTEGTDLYTFNGSESKTIDIKAGTNVTIDKTAGSITINASGGGTIQEKWTSATLVGSGLAISTVGNPALAALNGTDVAFIDTSNDQLRTYRFNGSTWSLVGSGLAISTVGNPALAALNGTDVAFIDGTNAQLRTYRFNGSTWSLVGSGLTISITGYQALAALNGTDVAFIDYNNDQLRTYRFGFSLNSPYHP